MPVRPLPPAADRPRRSRLGRTLLAFAVGFATGVAVMWWLFLRPPEEVPVATLPPAEGERHPAIEGRFVLCKAILPPAPGRRATARWDFGDGTDPVEAEVENPYAVWASHIYEGAAAGSVFDATVEVTDLDTGEVARGAYPVEFVEPTFENRRTVAIHDGLWSLHAGMKRWDDPVHGRLGNWDHKQYTVGATALSVLAFEVNGFHLLREEGHPYLETVDRALAYLLSTCRKVEIPEQPAGNPDSNGNGFGLSAECDRPPYEVPILAMALLASLDRERIATAGPEGVAGRRYDEIVTDIVDWMAFAQSESSGPTAGGWRYSANAASSDMSATQWPVLALIAAERLWGIVPPPWVRTELAGGILSRVQNAAGGIGYQDDNSPNVARTGAGMIAFTFAGVPSDDERMTRATAWIGDNWKRGNIGDYYAMYAVMKAAHLADPPIETFGEHDWLREYGDHLHAKQKEDGSWPNDREYARGPLSTAWPTLILSKDVFSAPPPASPSWWRTAAGAACGGLAVLLLLAVAALFARRRRDRTVPDGEPSA